MGDPNGMEKGMQPIGGPMGMHIGYAGFQTSIAGAQSGGIGVSSQAPNKNDKSRPISSNAVAGTPWCVVWTGDNKVTNFSVDFP